MAFECRAFAWIQLSECLESENVTQMTDGTKKYGKHYESLDVRTAAGECMTLVQSMIANMKNTMSDRESAVKKFNELLYGYRRDVLSRVMSEWE